MIQLNEMVEVGKKSADSGFQNVFFVGTHSGDVQISADGALVEFKAKHKNLATLTVVKGFFVTSLPQYAMQYAENFADENHTDAIVLAMEFKKDIKFFDLTDPADYDAIGVDKDLANIFISAEPYFSINTMVDSKKMPYQPYEFSVVSKMLKSKSWDIDLADKNFYKKLNRLSSSANFSQEYEEFYRHEMSDQFKYILGPWNSDALEKYETVSYSTRENFMHELKHDIDSAIEYQQKETAGILSAVDGLKIRPTVQQVAVLSASIDAALSGPASKWLSKKRLISILDDISGAVGESDADTPDMTKIYKSISMLYNNCLPVQAHNRLHVQDASQSDAFHSSAGAWKAGENMEDGIQSYMHTRALTHFPQSYERDPLFNNYRFLFGKSMDRDKQRDFKPFGASAGDLKLYMSYIKLFILLHEFMKGRQSLEGTGDIFRKGLARIKERINDKRKGLAAGKHIYIDILQYICFSMILEYCQKNKIDNVYGMAMREKIGYSAIRDKKVAYGYKLDELKDGFIQEKDRSLIMCRPFTADDLVICGHYLKGLKDTVESDLFRDTLDAAGVFRTAKQYQDFIRDLIDKICAQKKADYEKIYALRKKLYVTGRIYRLIGQNWNSEFFENLSDYEFDNYFGTGDLHCVSDWLTQFSRKSGYGFIITSYTVEYPDKSRSNSLHTLHEHPLYINIQVNSDVDRRFDTEYRVNLSDFNRCSSSVQEQIRHSKYGEETKTVQPKPASMTVFDIGVSFDTDTAGVGEFVFNFSAANQQEAERKLTEMLMKEKFSVPSYLFQKKTADNIDRLPDGFDGIFDFITDVGDRFFALTVRQDPVQQSNAVKSGFVTAEDERVWNEIRNYIRKALMPDGLVKEIQRWLAQKKLNYNLNIRKSWLAVAKAWFGCEFTQQELNMLAESELNEALSSKDSAKLRRDMKKGIVQFSYKKKSTGGIRKAKGTLKRSELPKFAEDRPAKPNAKNFVYWDIGKDEFRCFARENFIGFGDSKKDLHGGKSEQKMAESGYIDYIAHMLDECGALRESTVKKAYLDSVTKPKFDGDARNGIKLYDENGKLLDFGFRYYDPKQRGSMATGWTGLTKNGSISLLCDYDSGYDGSDLSIPQLAGFLREYGYELVDER